MSNFVGKMDRQAQKWTLTPSFFKFLDIAYEDGKMQVMSQLKERQS